MRRKSERGCFFVTIFYNNMAPNLFSGCGAIEFFCSTSKTSKPETRYFRFIYIIFSSVRR